jgi:hypothetical protein
MQTDEPTALRRRADGPPGDSAGTGTESTHKRPAPDRAAR